MTATTIDFVHARRVWDSRGRPTVEAEVHLRGGAIGRAIAPAGASTGSREAIELRDGGDALGGRDVQKALRAARGEISDALNGLDATDQERVDGVMIALDGSANRSRLGGNTLTAVSMACAHASARAFGRPLWRYLSDDGDVEMPLPEIQIFGGGLHAGGRVDIQDYMVVMPSAETFAEALRRTAEVYRAAGSLMEDRGLLQGVADEGGFWPAFGSNEEGLDCLMQAIERAGLRPGVDAAISLDIAASTFGSAGKYPSGPGRPGHEFGRDDRHACRLDRPLPHRVDRGPAGRGRSGRHGGLHRQSRRAGAGDWR